MKTPQAQVTSKRNLAWISSQKNHRGFSNDMWTRRAHKNTKKPLRTINQRPQNSKKNPEPAEFPSPSPEDGRTSRKGTFFGVEVIKRAKRIRSVSSTNGLGTNLLQTTGPLVSDTENPPLKSSSWGSVPSGDQDVPSLFCLSFQGELTFLDKKWPRVWRNLQRSIQKRKKEGEKFGGVAVQKDGEKKNYTPE